MKIGSRILYQIKLKNKIVHTKIILSLLKRNYGQKSMVILGEQFT